MISCIINLFSLLWEIIHSIKRKICGINIEISKSNMTAYLRHSQIWNYFFKKDCISDAQAFLRKVFDVNLYYAKEIYRKPTFLEVFAPISLQIKNEWFFIYRRKGILFQESSFVESRGATSNTLFHFYSLFRK